MNYFESELFSIDYIRQSVEGSRINAPLNAGQEDKGFKFRFLKQLDELKNHNLKFVYGKNLVGDILDIEVIGIDDFKIIVLAPEIEKDDELGRIIKISIQQKTFSTSDIKNCIYSNNDTLEIYFSNGESIEFNATKDSKGQESSYVTCIKEMHSFIQNLMGKIRVSKK